MVRCVCEFEKFPVRRVSSVALLASLRGVTKRIAILIPSLDLRRSSTLSTGRAGVHVHVFVCEGECECLSVSE